MNDVECLECEPIGNRGPKLLTFNFISSTFKQRKAEECLKKGNMHKLCDYHGGLKKQISGFSLSVPSPEPLTTGLSNTFNFL